ncbi:MAG TPA: Holliday junction resolvase RuvX [Pirellulaceae bacterium]|nr:Holliday junction resolvase RuvX [Pirellulaceae bacterium]HMO93388.1 Holliday junction resolvase RuvX [Pirellulaceae bacterium]HMP70448.1 Holliday junction resolvase RuvX [Pirellulaceae bacterium]
MNKPNQSIECLPKFGRLAGIDFGTSRIGIAVCDASQMIANPLSVYQRRNESLDRQFFQRLVQVETLVGFVVGLPLHLSGDESEMSLAARGFADWLKEISGLPVTFYDERLTSTLADDILGQAKKTNKRRKALRDKIAAQLILDAYLNRRKS